MFSWPMALIPSFLSHSFNNLLASRISFMEAGVIRTYAYRPSFRMCIFIYVFLNLRTVTVCCLDFGVSNVDEINCM